jgi:hypothetical protein
MAAKKLTVVITQAQGQHPVRKQLEEALVTELVLEGSVDVSVVPHLYDLTADHTGTLFLRSVPGDVVVLSWLYPRAARWILNRNGIKGHEGLTNLVAEVEDEGEEDPGETPTDSPEEATVRARDVPDRKIYCIDLRLENSPEPYLEEIRRIAAEKSVQTVDLMQWIQGDPNQAQLERYLHPERMIGAAKNAEDDAAGENGNNGELVESLKRRWYPVIDYSRCTNCMECIDFCLFGVYGVDTQETILVETQDNCKKGCPACSRVCPENAIIFPGHKTAAIAGAPGEVAGLKIDLSKLFGASDALKTAVEERDVELLADGREAVGMTVGLPERRHRVASGSHDELDDLIDGLDSLDF